MGLWVVEGPYKDVLCKLRVVGEALFGRISEGAQFYRSSCAFCGHFPLSLCKAAPARTAAFYAHIIADTARRSTNATVVLIAKGRL